MGSWSIGLRAKGEVTRAWVASAAHRVALVFLRLPEAKGHIVVRVFTSGTPGRLGSRHIDGESSRKVSLWKLRLQKDVSN